MAKAGPRGGKRRPDPCPDCARWQQSFDAVPDPIMIIDGAFRIERANRAMERMVRARPGALAGRLCYEVVHRTTAPVPACPHARLLADGRRHESESWEARLGSHLRVSVSPLRDAGGALTGSVHVAHDVTELREVAEALRQGEDLARVLVRLHELSADLTLPEVLDYALAELVRLTGSTVGYVSFYDEEREAFDLHAWSSGALRECRMAERSGCCSGPLAKAGLWGDVVRERRVVVTNDYGARGSRARGLPAGHVPLVRHMGGPVIVNDRIVAVAGVGNKPAPYLPVDEERLTNLMRGVWEIVLRKQSEEAVLGYQRSLRWLHRRLATTQEEERRRLAAEIHDTISQDLSAIRLRIATHCAARGGAQPDRESAGILAALEETIRASRALAYELSSPFLEQFGLAAALQWLAEDMGRRHDIELVCRCGEVPAGIPAERAALVHRIAQELLRNVVKHSRARRATLRLLPEGGALRLEVEDEGRGFVAPEPRSGATEGGGFGLFSVRERLRDVGGAIRIRTGPGEGTHVVVVVPVAAGGGDGA